MRLLRSVLLNGIDILSSCNRYICDIEEYGKYISVYNFGDFLYKGMAIFSNSLRFCIISSFYLLIESFDPCYSVFH